MVSEPIKKSQNKKLKKKRSTKSRQKKKRPEADAHNLKKKAHLKKRRASHN
jgi:hypothetical protein